MDYFDFMPQKFYLLSCNSRRLFSFESSDRTLEKSVEQAFSKIRPITGGNVYAEYRFKAYMLDIITELSERLKERYKNIQQLVSFFKHLKDNDFFIRQQAWVQCIDIKRSIIKLTAISKNKSPVILDTKFVLTWGVLFLKYNAYSYGYLTEKIYIGEKDKSKRTCRFCGRTGKQYYVSLSHSILNALGNELLFCNEECDYCNQELESTVEKQLFKFLEINRTLSCIRGKVSHVHHLEGLNFQIHPDYIDKKPIVYVKSECIINDFYKGRPTGRIILYNKDAISFYGLYKALVKIAVDMIPHNLFQHFINTGKWVHGDFNGFKLPPFLYGEHTDFFEQPELDLFFRNENSPMFSPFCTGILYIYEAIFIFILPFCDQDRDTDLTQEKIKSHLDYFKQKQYLFISEWEEIDPNNKDLKTPFYKIPLISKEDKYKIIFKDSSDVVFKRK